MIIYRLATETYKDDLTGTGAKLYGGRWNSRGLAGLYSTENISLAVLEILVRADKHTIPASYHLIKILVPDTVKPVIITHNKLKKSWKDDIGYTQFIGDEFLKTNQSLLLKVPSAVVDQENNYILNPRHPEFKKVKTVSTQHFLFDKRLFLSNE